MLIYVKIIKKNNFLPKTQNYSSEPHKKKTFFIIFLVEGITHPQWRGPRSSRETTEAKKALRPPPPSPTWMRASVVARSSAFPRTIPARATWSRPSCGAWKPKPRSRRSSTMPRGGRAATPLATRCPSPAMTWARTRIGLSSTASRSSGTSILWPATSPTCRALPRSPTVHLAAASPKRSRATATRDVCLLSICIWKAFANSNLLMCFHLYFWNFLKKHLYFVIEKKRL